MRIATMIHALWAILEILMATILITLFYSNILLGKKKKPVIFFNFLKVFSIVEKLNN